MTSKPPPVPNPGSRKAIAAGCVCPVLDNAHGKGFGIGEEGRPFFTVTLGCPLHGSMNWRD